MFLNSFMQVTSLPITIYNLLVIKTPLQSTSNKDTIRIVLPFIDQKPADIVKRQLTQLNKKLDINLQPVFVSRKLEDVLKFREPKPSLVSQQLVVYKFQCGSCDASYVGYTARHLHQRIEEHRYSAIGRHRRSLHYITYLIDRSP